MKIERNYGGEYVYISSTGTIKYKKNYFSNEDNGRYEVCNYFKTRREAEEILYKFKELLNED